VGHGPYATSEKVRRASGQTYAEEWLTRLRFAGIYFSRTSCLYAYAYCRLDCVR
jgi:hypothetical protein